MTKRGRWESIGFAGGLAEAADLATDWGSNARAVAANVKRKNSPESAAEFTRAVEALNKDLLHAYVTERVAAGADALGRALKSRSALEASVAIGQDPEEDTEATPVETEAVLALLRS